jgi:hypothetical protein
MAAMREAGTNKRDLRIRHRMLDGTHRASGWNGEIIPAHADAVSEITNANNHFVINISLTLTFARQLQIPCKY